MAASRININFDLPGEQKFERMFNNLEHVPDDFREPFEGMAEDFETQERQNFAEQGPGWKPLALSTQKDRTRKGYLPSGPILKRKGTLEASLADRTNDHAIYEVHPLFMELGSSLRTPNGKWNLAAIHQYGAEINRQTKAGLKTWRIPARPVVRLTQQLQRNWERRMAKWLRDEINYQG